MKILLAVDGSESSERAAAFMKRFDLTPHDEIIVLHVISEIPYQDDAYAHIKSFFKGVSSKVLKSATDILKLVSAKTITMEIEGYPDDAIMETAREENADLIVMGTRGLKGMQSFFVGSVTRSVAINAVKPVLVTRTPQWEPAENMKVLLATDGSDSAAATTRFLASMPFYPDTECVILHVTKSILSYIPEKFTAGVDAKIREDEARVNAKENRKAGLILEQAKEILNKRFKQIDVLSINGDPATEILKASRHFHADIIAGGCRGLKGMKGMMGSVSRRVLSHSECPVLIGRENQ